jgi:hypothetical protein
MSAADAVIGMNAAGELPSSPKKLGGATPTIV